VLRLETWSDELNLARSRTSRITLQVDHLLFLIETVALAGTELHSCTVVTSCFSFWCGTRTHRWLDTKTVGGMVALRLSTSFFSAEMLAGSGMFAAKS
jgi:hypothetical protein